MSKAAFLDRETPSDCLAVHYFMGAMMKMNSFDLFMECIHLGKAVCEAFAGFGEEAHSGEDPGFKLTDVRDDLEAFLPKIPMLLNEKQAELFRSKTGALLKDCEEFGKSEIEKEKLLEDFEDWNHTRAELFTVLAINTALFSRNNEEQAARLLEAVLSDKSAAQFEPVADYALGQVVRKLQPLRSYELGIKAFEQNNRLAWEIMPKDAPVRSYVYSRAEEDYFDRCPICHGTGTPFYCAAQVCAMNYNPMFSPMKLWMKCDSCGQLYTYNFPKKIAEPQPENEELGDALYLQPRLGLLPLFGDILKRVAQYTQGRKLLDVGAGSGELIAAALELGFDAEGIEISKRQALRLKELLKVEIHCMDFLSFQTSKRFDLITMGDVIEHVTDPAAAIKKANGLLAENGILWISTPNYESGFSRIRGFDDPMWLEPYHITYFCYRGFKKFLSEYGFEVLDYSISKRYNGSMEIIVKKRGG